MTSDTKSGETEDAQTTEATAAAAQPPSGIPEEERTEEDDVWDELEAAERGEKPAGAETGDGDETAAAAAEAAAEGDEEPTAATGDGDGDQPPAQAAEENDKNTDIWADAPEALRSAFDAERQRADRAEQSFRSRQGREAALQRRLDALIAGEGTRPEDGTGAEAPATRQPGADDSANNALAQQLETLKTDYPEFAPLAEAVTRLEAQGREDRATINRLTQGLQTVGEGQLNTVIAEQEQMVLDRHQDFTDIQDSDEFVAWAQGQPEFVQAGIVANAEQIVDGPGVIWILDRYKADRGIDSGKDGGSAAGEEAPGKTKPATDPIRQIQRRSAAGTPRPSAGAAVPEQERSSTETEDDVWDEIERKEKQRLEAAA